MSNILLFGGFVQVLSAAASLKKRGHQVFVAVKDDNVAKRSRFIDQYLNWNDILNAQNAEKEILGIIEKWRIDVVIPMEDEYAACLSQVKPAIENKSSCRCAVMDWDVFNMVSDKSALLEFCKRHDIGHPQTEQIRNDYEAVGKQVGFPALIKPNHSEGSKGIMLVNNLEELKQHAPGIIAQYGECTLQEYIENDHYYNLMIYRTKDGKFSNHVIIKILRYYPVKGGSSCFAVSVDDDKMVDMCKRLLDALHWVGMADFDILEKGTGDYRIIEINPRVPASLRGAEMSGVNFPEIIISDSLGKPIPHYAYITGKYLRFLGLDLAWFMASPKRFSCNPSWFRFFGKDIYYEDGGLRDLPSMLTYIWSGIKKQLSPEFRKTKAGLN